MRCEKCGNKIKELFVCKNGEYLCRKCLVYRECKVDKKYFHGSGEYKLNYQLTKQQKEASDFILKEIKQGRDCVLNAVTGAGKTEIIYELIKYCVDNNKKIGIVIPRKDVVIELFSRIQHDFKMASVIGVYGGNNKILFADIIVLTSHQLFRYQNYFDVIVLDEVDAFPFFKNDLLNNFLIRSVKGNIVYMSATIPKTLLESGNKVYFLNRRFHGHILDVPKIKYFWCRNMIIQFVKRNFNCINIIYFPTIKLQLRFSKKFKIKHYLINSKVEKRKQLLELFHTLDSGVILSTLVLERGVTFKNANVIVYRADHQLFSYENLVQISGRVGRNKLYPHGKIIFLVNKKNQNIKKAIKFIKKCNE